ncbi:hypothetical protein GTR00_18420, partial [Kineococcus sp. T90]|nr:hypothetical protein [Kineococcus indalonis]
MVTPFPRTPGEAPARPGSARDDRDHHDHHDHGGGRDHRDDPWAPAGGAPAGAQGS